MYSYCPVTLPVANIYEQNVVFVVCVSESSPSDQYILKELLIKTLYSLANKLLDSMINIISCSNKSLKWQDGLVNCSLVSVIEAADWIRTVQTNGGTSVLSALAAAQEDPISQAVYLFTDGLPMCAGEEICSHLKESEPARPVHVVYLVGSREDSKSDAQKILENIAKESGGSFQPIHLNSGVASDKDNPGGVAGIIESECVSKQHCMHSSAGHQTTQFPMDTWNLDSPNTFLRSSSKEDLGDWSLTIHSLPKGIRVLARKETDGYYYLGHIVQNIKSSRKYVLVQFETSQHTRKGQVQFQMQETPLYDVIDHEEARWQPLAPGDGVLALCKKKAGRYGPGVILQVEETASSHSAFKNSKVVVNFWNGQTKQMPADVAVQIPPSLRDRIVLELQMPLAVRQMLVEQNPDYPYVAPPGYRASGQKKQNHLDWMPWHEMPRAHHVGTRCSSTWVPFCCFCTASWESAMSPGLKIQQHGTLIQRTSQTVEGQSKKTEQLSKRKLPISEHWF